jgi:hypothetical protein
MSDQELMNVAGDVASLEDDARIVIAGELSRRKLSKSDIIQYRQDVAALAEAPHEWGTVTAPTSSQKPSYTGALVPPRRRSALTCESTFLACRIPDSMSCSKSRCGNGGGGRPLVESQRILRAVQSLEADSGGSKLCHKRLPLGRIGGGELLVLADSAFKVLLLLWHAAEIEPDGRWHLSPPNWRKSS